MFHPAFTSPGAGSRTAILLLAGLLTAATACDRQDAPQATTADETDYGLRLEATRIATTQGTLTVNDQNLVTRFPLPLMPNARVDQVSQLERPGQPLTLQMSIESAASMDQVADFYENAMRAKGLHVQRSVSASDPNQILLMGETEAASATALVDRGLGNRPTTASLTWTEKRVTTPAE